MGNKFPYRIRIKKDALQELRSSEYGSYEDHCNGRRATMIYRTSRHIVEMIDESPFQSVVVVENQDELDEFYVAACSGTWGLHCPRIAVQTLQRIADDVTPEHVKNWPAEHAIY